MPWTLETVVVVTTHCVTRHPESQSSWFLLATHL